MNTLVAAYVVVWVGVAVYGGWLGVRQSRLDARLTALRSQIDHKVKTTDPLTRAA